MKKCRFYDDCMFKHPESKTCLGNGNNLYCGKFRILTYELKESKKKTKKNNYKNIFLIGNITYLIILLILSIMTIISHYLLLILTILLYPVFLIVVIIIFNYIEKDDKK
ncbi:MAG: hypothetical protein ACFFAO_02150 [Candidatus Hermodarchaeota archaeon]